MARNFPPTKRKYYFIIVSISLVVLLIAGGAFFLIPETYRPYYGLGASFVFMIDVLIMPSLKSGILSDDDKKARPFWILLGILIIFEALVFVFSELSPQDAFPWIFSIVEVSSLLTSFVLYQYLRERKVIP